MLLSKALYHTCFTCGQRCKWWSRRPKLTSSVISDVKPIIYIIFFFFTHRPFQGSLLTRFSHFIALDKGIDLCHSVYQTEDNYYVADFMPCGSTSKWKTIINVKMGLHLSKISKPAKVYTSRYIIAVQNLPNCVEHYELINTTYTISDSRQLLTVSETKCAVRYVYGYLTNTC